MALLFRPWFLLVDDDGLLAEEYMVLHQGGKGSWFRWLLLSSDY